MPEPQQPAALPQEWSPSRWGENEYSQASGVIKSGRGDPGKRSVLKQKIRAYEDEIGEAESDATLQGPAMPTGDAPGESARRRLEDTGIEEPDYDAAPPEIAELTASSLKHHFPKEDPGAIVMGGSGPLLEGQTASMKMTSGLYRPPAYWGEGDTAHEPAYFDFQSPPYMHTEPNVNDVLGLVAQYRDVDPDMAFAYDDIEKNGKESEYYREIADRQWVAVFEGFKKKGVPVVRLEYSEDIPASMRLSGADEGDVSRREFQLSQMRASDRASSFVGGADIGLTGGFGRELIGVPIAEAARDPDQAEVLAELEAQGVIGSLGERAKDSAVGHPGLSVLGGIASLGLPGGGLGGLIGKGATKVAALPKILQGTSLGKIILRGGATGALAGAGHTAVIEAAEATGSAIRDEDEHIKSPEEVATSIALGGVVGGGIGGGLGAVSGVGTKAYQSLRGKDKQAFDLLSVERALPEADPKIPSKLIGGGRQELGTSVRTGIRTPAAVAEAEAQAVKPQTIDPVLPRDNPVEKVVTADDLLLDDLGPRIQRTAAENEVAIIDSIRKESEVFMSNNSISGRMEETTAALASVIRRRSNAPFVRTKEAQGMLKELFELKVVDADDAINIMRSTGGIRMSLGEAKATLPPEMASLAEKEARMLSLGPGPTPSGALRAPPTGGIAQPPTGGFEPPGSAIASTRQPVPGQGIAQPPIGGWRRMEGPRHVGPSGEPIPQPGAGGFEQSTDISPFTGIRQFDAMAQYRGPRPGGTASQAGGAVRDVTGSTSSVPGPGAGASAATGPRREAYVVLVPRKVNINQMEESIQAIDDKVRYGQAQGSGDKALNEIGAAIRRDRSKIFGEKWAGIKDRHHKQLNELEARRRTLGTGRGAVEEDNPSQLLGIRSVLKDVMVPVHEKADQVLKIASQDPKTLTSLRNYAASRALGRMRGETPAVGSQGDILRAAQRAARMRLDPLLTRGAEVSGSLLDSGLGTLGGLVPSTGDQTTARALKLEEMFREHGPEGEEAFNELLRAVEALPPGYTPETQTSPTLELP